MGVGYIDRRIDSPILRKNSLQNSLKCPTDKRPALLSFDNAPEVIINEHPLIGKGGDKNPIKHPCAFTNRQQLQ